MARPRKQKVEITCQTCGKKKFVIPALKDMKYCSQPCFHIGITIKSEWIDGVEYRKCTHAECDQREGLIPIAEFPVWSSGRRDGWCRACRNKDRKRRLREPHGRFMAAKLAAKRRGIAWKLSEKEYVALAFSPCIYCGESTGEVGVGLDRTNSKHGYTKENVVPCCCGCNRVRGEDYIPYETMLNEVAPIIRRLKAIPR